MDSFASIDFWIIGGWMAFTFAVGVWFSRRASRSTEDFFVSGRSLPWWVVGTSMVATTFAADTPLLVSGLVAKGGIFGNWFWWTLGFSGMVSVFLFAKLWRRSGVLTDAELVELRYGSHSGAVLRGAKALWFGAFHNVLVIAWVMAAMRKIAVVVLDIDADSQLELMQFADGTSWAVDSWVAIAVSLFTVSVFYTSAAGMWGVVTTDFVQFVLAMTIAIVFAFIAWNAAGELEGIRSTFQERGLDWAQTSRIVPTISSTEGSNFLLLVGVIWWGQHNIDGGGYLAQRLFSAKDERHAVLGYLWFTVAHICLRPWPWIVVGLAGMALLGPAGEGLAVDDPEKYYPLLMKQLLPAGLFGLMVASFLAAFMSTIDTQLNWGASLLTNDLYKRFINPNADEKTLVRVSRLAIVALAALGVAGSLALDDIQWAWELAFSVTAGLGTVYVARWYWWRTNASSEMAGMVCAGVCTFGFSRAAAARPDDWVLAEGAIDWLKFPGSTALTTLISIGVWVTVTLLTRPVSRERLLNFYERVRPGGPGWRVIAGDREGFESDGPNLSTLLGIVSGWVACFSCLFAVGWWILGQYTSAGCAVVLGVLASGSLWRQLKRVSL